MLRTRVLKLIKQGCLACGLDVQYATNTMESARTREFKHERIDLVLDVGANSGQYAALLRANGFAGEIISYEPIPEIFSALKHNRSRDALWRGENCALSFEEGQATFHVSENTVSSSLLEVTQLTKNAEVRTATSRNIEVELRTLDSEIRHISSERRIHLKLDVQGSELDALRGAKDSLSRVRTVECELSFDTLYSNQPLFFEVAQFLHSAGFRAIWFERGFTNGVGQLLQIDALFVRCK